MNVKAHLIFGPLSAAQPLAVPGAGAVASYEHYVLPGESERKLAAIIFEDYEPMTRMQLSRLGEQMFKKYDLIALRATHSRRRVPAGRCSFRLQVASKHRREGLMAVNEFVETMPGAVPLWQTMVWRDQEDAFSREPVVRNLSRGYTRLPVT